MVSVDINSRRYLVYLNYCTLKLRPVMVYPKVLYLEISITGSGEKHTLSLTHIMMLSSLASTLGCAFAPTAACRTVYRHPCKP